MSTNKSFGIYDTTNESIVCDPIAGYDQLRGILQRHGIPTENVIFEKAQSLHHMLLLPGNTERKPPPAAWGYNDRLTQWTNDNNLQLIRSIEYTKMSATEFSTQVIQIIRREQEQALSILETDYTDREIKSWPQQRAEAAEYARDNTKEVPLLMGMAKRREIPLATFVEHVLSKVKVNADLTAIILGDAQAANDRIKALQVLDETDNLPPDWFDQLTDIADNWRKDWPNELLQAQ